MLKTMKEIENLCISITKRKRVTDTGYKKTKCKLYFEILRFSSDSDCDSREENSKCSQD